MWLVSLNAHVLGERTWLFEKSKWKNTNLREIISNAYLTMFNKLLNYPYQLKKIIDENVIVSFMQ